MHPEFRYWHTVSGHNFRMPALSAALGCAQLESLTSFTSRRSEIQHNYRVELDGLLVPPSPINESHEAPWLFTGVRPGEGGPSETFRIAEALANSHVETRPIFRPLHQMPAFSRYRHAPCPASEHLGWRGISLPTHSGISPEAQDKIIRIVKKEVN